SCASACAPSSPHCLHDALPLSSCTCCRRCPCTACSSAACTVRWSCRSPCCTHPCLDRPCCCGSGRTPPARCSPPSCTRCCPCPRTAYCSTRTCASSSEEHTSELQSRLD